MTTLSIACEWISVDGAPGNPYRYPGPVTEHIEEAYSTAIYRWGVCRRDSQGGSFLHSVYVGEAEVLASRLKGYLHPGRSQLTNLRIKEWLDQELAVGSTI